MDRKANEEMQMFKFNIKKESSQGQDLQG